MEVKNHKRKNKEQTMLCQPNKIQKREILRKNNKQKT